MTKRFLAALLAGLPLSACATLPAESGGGPVEVQILALNDFHGHLEQSPGDVSYVVDGQQRSARLGGAAQLGATLDALREGNPHTITVAAGDLIGASPLISALFLDEPTIRALSVVGLDLASVGNHEFDRGIAELQRMQNGGCEANTQREPCAIEPFAGADFAYLAGNTVDAAGNTLFSGTAMREYGDARVGFIGLTLEGTANLVADQATAGYTFLDEAETANRFARELVADGADAVVLLIHEGGYVDDRFVLDACPDLSGPIVPIVEALDPAISLVVSGHSHNSYICNLTRPGGEPVLLTSAGRYGGFVTQIVMTVDPTADRALSVTGRSVAVTEPAVLHAEAAAIVARYAEAVRPVAERAVGPIAASGAAGRDCLDSPAQAFIADAYLDMAREAGEPVDLAFVNSGGVRTDLSGAADGVLTYGELSAMAPFGNAVTVLSLTGGEIAELLEGQWCDEGGLASACESLLVPSDALRYTVDRAAPAGERVAGITLAGQPLDLQRTYRVATNSFLAGGGDGFSIFTEARDPKIVGFDIDGIEAYVARGTVSVPVCGRVATL
ncbi:bifunctional metallophosphatase/5'-nucleotidase [Aurantiacibacter aquimixticola]|uniref:Bifunctional metallophosphatase/5'-nucleotidase n=1 Tax=Aurantiacibacter aquimixticola TaxID=1958945 RepID=A0A419RW57_9SPHN|nr:bifunctional metallophosphatase/5'-nucleotidase [Aurantiacibacter aquimixticola]RJY10011.1 bifunctional metallophosphatase/5'-nucleotidase [Aurantiacibacter aquimixticola]